MTRNILSFDVGTTGLKTSLYNIKKKLTLLAASSHEYSLKIGQRGEAEQNPEEWWNAMKITVQRVLDISGIKSKEIQGSHSVLKCRGLFFVIKKVRL